MKRGFKALAVLAALVAASAGPQAFAFCVSAQETPAIFQCADRAWFAPPPAGSGAVTGAFWGIGFGNRNLNTGQGSDGTAFASKAFNGNDSGTFEVNILDAAASFPGIGFPAGSVCLGSNNWANAGVDGCCDNPRDSAQAFADDNTLNPLFDVAALNGGYPGVPSTDWVQDAPLGVLLTESNGHFYAVASVSNMARTGPNDIRAGFYSLADVTNGQLNTITGAHNIVGWQRIPGDKDPNDPLTHFVRVGDADPNTPAREATLGWISAGVYSDGSSLPSTNPTVIAIGLSGMGVNDHSISRYVIEEQAIVDPNNPLGSLNPNGWSAHTPASGPTPDGMGGFTAQVTVPPDTCLRLHTYFGVAPQTSTHSLGNCRQGICGDLGFEVVSPPSCLGGALASDGVPGNASAVRGKGGVDVSFETAHELSVSNFKIYALTQASGRIEVASLNCTECTTGNGALYKARIPMGQLKGARDLEIVASTGASAKVTIK